MMDVCYRDRSCRVQRQNLISMFSSTSPFHPPSRHLPAAKTTGLFLDKEKTNDSKDDNDGGVSFDELWQKEVGVVETLRGESQRSKGNQGTILRSRPHLQKCLKLAKYVIVCCDKNERTTIREAKRNNMRRQFHRLSICSFLLFLLLLQI